MLARNSLLGALATGVPLVLGVLLLPVAARALGPERFGLLGLAWALLEQFALFELGLGRATTKFVAEALAGDRSRIPQLVAVSLTGQLVLGAIGGAALAVAAPLLIDHVLHVPAALRSEGVLALRLIGLTLPAVLVSLGLRGLLEAAERFDVLALIRIPSSSATFAIPAVAALAGADLPAIITMLLVARLATVAALALAARATIPDVSWAWPREWTTLRPLITFGGWLTVSNVANPLFLYFDRFTLGALRGIAAVGFYTAPFELAYRLLVVPGSIASALFPAASAALAAGDRARAESLYQSALRMTGLLLLPICLTMIALAPEVLRLWLGNDFAERAAPALRILAAGVLVNGLAHMPSAAMHAAGRPDVNAKLHLAELVLHVPLTLGLVRAFGIAGAAAAWSIRATLDAVLLTTAVRRVVGLSATAAFARGGAWLLVAVLVLGGALWAASASSGSLAGLGLATTGGLVGYGVILWGRVLDATERAAALRLLPGRRASREADATPA